jgi:hypothetical protein
MRPYERLECQWRDCDPKAMATMSQAAIMYAFQDARSDILRLHDEVRQLRQALDGETRAK